jgi:hypothetical protein
LDGLAVKSLSLQDCYGSEAGLCHPDPHVRIAAIHHAARRLDHDPRAFALLEERLRDADSLVARYAAVALAQAGRTEGLACVLQAMQTQPEAEREPWEKCLRDCTRFPFAVLLNELLWLPSLDRAHDSEGRNLLRELLVVTGEHFTARLRELGRSREPFLRRIILAGMQLGADLRPRRWPSAATCWPRAPGSRVCSPASPASGRPARAACGPRRSASTGGFGRG